MSGNEIQPNPDLVKPVAVTARFSNRVENYVLYRPRYPREVVETLNKHHGLGARKIVADIGSGTGILTELFVDNSNIVEAVEPNRHMREAAEKLFMGEALFNSHAGTAEATGLENASVDYVAAGQSFHWFDSTACRLEFKRILRPEGQVVIIWNHRRTDSTPFLIHYEALLQKFGTDYQEVDHKKVTPGSLEKFFGKAPKVYTFPNNQRLDWEGLKGRLLSSSYVPAAGEARYPEMLEELKQIFSRHRSRGNVVVEYDTRMYVGKLW
jgi:SAM-dependent methyltransferase